MARPSRPAFPRFFLWLLPLSFVLQVAAIGAFHQYRTRPGDDHFEFGWEMGRVGRSIALGQGFSSPYDGNTGPTAWEPPLYPNLIGGVFKIFGIYTHASAWVLLSINSLFATLTCIHARYRHPIELELLILIVFLLSEVGRRTAPTLPAEGAPQQPNAV